MRNVRLETMKELRLETMKATGRFLPETTGAKSQFYWENAECVYGKLWAPVG